MSIRPSSLPMLQACPKWEAGDPSEFAEAGDARHKAFAHRLSGEDDVNMLDEPDADAVQWAADYVAVHMPSDHPLRIEQGLRLLDDDFQLVMKGRPDATCGPELFDFKWRQRDYAAQMAAYALMMFQEQAWPSVRVHLLFGEAKRAEVFRFEEAEALALVNGIVGRVTAPDAAPTPCDYCGWCARRLTCPALLSRAEEVAHGYSDSPSVKTWHPSEMETGQELADALWVWRTVLKKWGESIEYHALEAAQKKGLTLPGFSLKDESGGNYITDIPQAFALTGLPQDEFLKACDLRMKTSKKYPDKLGLVNVAAAFAQTSQAAAEREIKRKLADVMKAKKRRTYLKEDKETITEEEEQ